jgi:hypothetical protein
MSRVLFVETSAQATWICTHLSQGERGTLLAVTAEAIEALDARGLAHIPAREVCDFRQFAEHEYGMNVGVVRLAGAVESFVKARRPELRFEGPGFVSGQGYPLFHAAVGIAARAILGVSAIRALDARAIGVFGSPLDPWFADDGYERDPWIEVVRHAEPGVAVDVLPMPISRSAHDSMRPPLYDRIRNRIEASWRRAVGGNRARRSAAPSPDLRGLRLLFPIGATYDWLPVTEALRSSGNSHVAEMDGETLGYFWPYAFVPAVIERASGQRHELSVPSFARDPEEEATVERILGEWLQERPEQARFPVGVVDVFPGLQRHLTQVTRRSPALLRHADRVAAAALEQVRPDAVCFFAMPLLAEKRFAHACRRRSVPVICYQHGATYGTHRVAQHAQIEQAHADVFLTYGEGTREHTYPEFPSRAVFVPVGSARIEAMRRAATPRRRRGRQVRVLWIGEYATGNAFNATHTLEDTRRYAVEQEGLRLLAAASPSLHVIYRPHRHQLKEVGTVRWIQRACPAVAVEAVRPLEHLINDADVIVSDGASGQVWYETMALGRPLILFCDPQQSLLWPEFERDLDRACRWCRDESEFFAALRRLCKEPAEAMSALSAIDAAPFVRKYILHHGSDGPADRVRRLLSSLRDQRLGPGSDLVRPTVS